MANRGDIGTPPPFMKAKSREFTSQYSLGSAAHWLTTFPETYNPQNLKADNIERGHGH